MRESRRPAGLGGAGLVPACGTSTSLSPATAISTFLVQRGHRERVRGGNSGDGAASAAPETARLAYWLLAWFTAVMMDSGEPWPAKYVAIAASRAWPTLVGKAMSK
jgi:hypothetical protein